MIKTQTIGVYSETLSRNSADEFFLCVEGGSNSTIPMSKYEAQDWVWEHFGCDKYREIFGAVEE